MINSLIQTRSTCGYGSPESDLSNGELTEIVREALADIRPGTRVLALIPDKTRDDNTHILFPAAAAILAEIGAARLDALVAQGTHSPMTGAEKFAKIGVTNSDEVPLLGTIYDHRWDKPEDLVSIGELTADEVRRLTGGLFDESIPLAVNRLAASSQYDTILIFGATVPHEVAGFAGGAKYFFPGISGPQLTHKTHWLAALATIEKIIGRVETPTRHLIEAAADRIEADIISFTSVASRGDDDRLRTYALFAGDFRLALRSAAEVSRKVHIKYTDRKYRRVVAVLDEHYEDLWVGGKASYRLGGIIEDGGELIIYAPKLRCISDRHGVDIERFGGYAPLENIKDLVARSGELQANLCVAAHLAHVSYAGRTDDEGKIVSKYQITLASQVDRETCERVKLGYLDFRSFNPDDHRNDPEILVVDHAGRDLYLLEPAED
jgi:nickel-dependent lactate racemase